MGLAEVRKINVVARKRHGKPKKTWNEERVDDRRKLGMESTDPQNCSECRTVLSGEDAFMEDFLDKPNPSGPQGRLEKTNGPPRKIKKLLTY